MGILHAITEREFLTPAEEKRLQEVLEKAEARFTNMKGLCVVGEHVIHMKHDRRIKQKYYPCNPAMQDVLD